MNREIKFRAWYKADLELGAPIKFTMDTKDDEIKFIATDEGFSFSYPFALVFTDDDFIIEQYTGLNDNNGVEIYRGDIVKWGHLNNEEKTHRIAIVEMYPDIQFHLMKNDVVFKFGSFAYQDTESHLEVIGNIHENEELLK